MTWDAAVEAERPWLIDFYCCEGGASEGYFRAGWRVCGVGGYWVAYDPMTKEYRCVNHIGQDHENGSTR